MRCKDGKILWAVVLFLSLLAIPAYADDFEGNWIALRGEINNPASGILEIPVRVNVTDFNKEYTWSVKIDNRETFTEDLHDQTDLPCAVPCEFDDTLKVITFRYANGIHILNISLKYHDFMPDSSYDENYSISTEVEFKNENMVARDWEPGTGGYIPIDRFLEEDKNNEIYQDLKNEGYLREDGGYVTHDIENVFRDYLGPFDLSLVIPRASNMVHIIPGFDAINNLWNQISGWFGKTKTVWEFFKVVDKGSVSTFIVKEAVTAEAGVIFNSYMKDYDYWDVNKLEPTGPHGDYYIEYVTVKYATPENMKFENMIDNNKNYCDGKNCFTCFETRLYHLTKDDIWKYNKSAYFCSSYADALKEDFGTYVEPISTPSIIKPGEKVEWKFKVKNVLPFEHTDKADYQDQLYEKPLGLMYFFIIIPSQVSVSSANITFSYNDGRKQTFGSEFVFSCVEGTCLSGGSLPPGHGGWMHVPILLNAEEEITIELTGVDPTSFTFQTYYNNNLIRYGLIYDRLSVDIFPGIDISFLTSFLDGKMHSREINIIPSLPQNAINENNIKILPWSKYSETGKIVPEYNIILKSFLEMDHMFVLFDNKYIGQIPSIFTITGSCLVYNAKDCFNIFGNWVSFKTNKIDNITLVSENDFIRKNNLYSKSLTDSDFKMKNRPDDDFEGYITDGYVKVGMLADGTYQVNVTNNQLIFNIFDNNLHVFVFSKYSNDWQDTFTVPYLQTKTLKLDYGPDLIITETYDGRAWKYVPVLPSYYGKECTSNDQCVSNNCAACSGQTAHCCPAGQSWTGFICSDSCNCKFDTDCDACQKCENNKCINSSSDASGKCTDGCCEAGKCYSKGACSPLTISKCGESNKWFVPTCGDGICECGENALSCSADCTKKDNGLKCSSDGECSSGNCAPAVETGGYPHCCGYAEIWDGYKCTQNNYCTLDTDCEACQKCQEGTCVADNHDPSGKCGNGCCEAGVCYPSGYVSQIYTERCENKVWWSLCPSTNCMKDYDGNERLCKECSASDVENGYCNEVSVLGTTQKCYYGDPDTNFMHGLCNLGSDCDGTPDKEASTCSEIAKTGYVSCDYLGFRCNCADTCDGNLRVYQPLKACLAGETCYEVGGCLYKYCSACGTDACAGGQCTAVPNNAVCQDTQCLPGYSPAYDTWSRSQASSTCFTLLPKGTCTKCDSGLSYYTTEYIDSCEKTKTAFYYGSGYDSQAPSKISEGIWNPKLTSSEESWLSGIKCTAWNSVDKCTQCSEQTEKDYEVRAECASPIPTTYLLCGDSGSMKCYDPNTYECCSGDKLIKKDQDSDGTSDHQCCIDGVSNRGCSGSMPSEERPVLSYASKDIMFDETNCGGCGKICKKSSLGACIEFGYSSNNICSGETPQCCGGACSSPRPDLEVSSLNFYPTNLIEGAKEMVMITVKRNDEFDSQNVITDNVKVIVYVDGQPKGEGFVNLPESSTADLLIDWEIEFIGNHDVKIVVDPDNTISECKRSNNVLVKNVTVSKKPDLTFNDYFNTFAWGNTTTIGGDWETYGFSTDASGLASASSNKCGGTKYMRKRVEGPGKLSFMWKAQASGLSSSNIGFFVDGAAVYQYASSFDWNIVNYNIPDGKHIIEWGIGYVSSGCSDDYITIWIDLVRPNVMNTVAGWSSSGEKVFFLNIPKNSETGKAVFDIGYEKEIYQTTETFRTYCSKQCVTAGQRVSCDATDVLKTIDPPGEGLYKFNITTPSCSPNAGTITYTITCTGGNAGTYNGCGQSLLINCTKIDIKADCWGANNCYGATYYKAVCDIGANPTITYESMALNNVSITVKPNGNTTKEIWKKSGEFSGEFTIPDIAADVNNYIKNCTDVYGFCKFPVSIKSSSGGNLRINNINVNYRSNSSFGSVPSLNASCTSYAATCSSQNEKTYLLEGLAIVEPTKIIRQSSQVDTSSPYATSITSASFIYNLTCYKDGISKKYDMFNLANFTCTTSGCGSGTSSCYYTCQSNSFSNLTLDCDRIVLYTYCYHSYTGQKRAGCSISTDTTINILPRSYMKIMKNGVETSTVADGDMITLSSLLNNIGSTNTNNFINVLYVDGNPVDYEIVQMNGTESKEVSFNWTAVAGTHNITMKADDIPSPDGLTPETAEGNNEISLIIKIKSLKISPLSPANGSLVANNKPAFNFIVSGDQNAYPCQLLVDNMTYGRSDVVLSNMTSSISANSTIPEGSHSWQIKCVDSTDSKKSEPINIVIDTVPPSVSITSPQNTTYFTDKISMATSIQEASTCWYSLDKWITKTQYDCISTIFLAKLGSNTISVEAVDAAGNSNKQSVSYTVGIYNKAVTITEKSNTNLTNYQVKINMDYQAQMKSDFSDIKFTDSDKATPLNYWIEIYNSTNAIVWVKVPQIAAISTKTIYMYYGLQNFYGNISINSKNDGNLVFEFFDDFKGSSLNLTKWNQNAVNNITHTINNSFRFEDATKSSNTYWIYSGSYGGSQHQATWIPISNFAVEWESTVYDKTFTEMGEGGIAVVDASNKIIYYPNFADWCGGFLTLNVRVLDRTGTGYIQNLAGSECTANGNSSMASRKFTLIKSGNNYETRVNDISIDTYNTTTSANKISLAAGAYGGYPYLDYVEIAKLRVRKYAYPEPSAIIS